MFYPARNAIFWLLKIFSQWLISKLIFSLKAIFSQWKLLIQARWLDSMRFYFKRVIALYAVSRQLFSIFGYIVVWPWSVNTIFGTRLKHIYLETICLFADLTMWETCAASLMLIPLFEIFLPQAFVFAGHAMCYHSNYMMLWLPWFNEYVLPCTSSILNLMVATSTLL